MAISVYSGMVKIEDCYSGALKRSKRSVASQIVLATTGALDSLDHNRFLLASLQRHYVETGEVHDKYLATAGFEVSPFHGFRGNVLWGVRLNNALDERGYQAARDLLKSLKEGAHRSVFFAMLGVKTSGIDGLPPASYAALLAKLHPHFHDSLREVRVRDTKADRISNSSEGVNAAFSRALLASHQFWSHITENFAIEDPASA